MIVAATGAAARDFTKSRLEIFFEFTTLNGTALEEPQTIEISFRERINMNNE